MFWTLCAGYTQWMQQWNGIVTDWNVKRFWFQGNWFKMMMRWDLADAPSKKWSAFISLDWSCSLQIVIRILILSCWSVTMITMQCNGGTSFVSAHQLTAYSAIAIWWPFSSGPGKPGVQYMGLYICLSTTHLFDLVTEFVINTFDTWWQNL